jgi:hypothetical protein
MSVLVCLVIDRRWIAKNIGLPDLPLPGELIELADGTCVIVSRVEPSRGGLVDAEVRAKTPTRSRRGHLKRRRVEVTIRRAAMTTVLCTCQVADYETFRPGYDRAVNVIPDIRSYRLWRGQDDPNLVVIEETFDSRGIAEAIWTSPQTKAAMEADGIDMSSLRIEYLDEVDSGAHEPDPGLDLGVPK